MILNKDTRKRTLEESFSYHKYLLVSIIKCLQDQRQLSSANQTDHHEFPLDCRIPNSELKNELIPCIVVRDHSSCDEISITEILVNSIALPRTPISKWMNRAIHPLVEPNRDILHLAMESELPQPSIILHSIDAHGKNITHSYSLGIWTVCSDSSLLISAIRQAQILFKEMQPARRKSMSIANTISSKTRNVNLPCNLSMISQIYDHIAVRASLMELQTYGQIQKSKAGLTWITPGEQDSAA